MATVLDCARLAQAAYGGDLPAGWQPLGQRHQATGGLWGGFQGLAASQGSTVVFAFKGTAPGSVSGVSDITADIKLGAGMNTVQFDQANLYVEQMAAQVPDGATVYVCGHSLGGAIAQIVGNRRRLPLVTFNAPGVGVIAGNLGELALQSPLMATVRAAGSALSVLRHPVQAAQDAASLFHRVQGTNVRLATDPVSLIGIHYGRLATLPYSGSDPHGIATMIGVLEDTPTTGLVNLEGFTRR